MSLDFPNREEWLAYRTRYIIPRRYIHISGYGLAARRRMPGGMEMAGGKTYDVGRNKTKRAKKTAYAVTIQRSGLVKAYMLRGGKQSSGRR